ncbi:MAG: hypothetical protein VB061_07510 [Christensenella sp.]|nr:hypothetical protein [Christensenella sp.]
MKKILAIALSVLLLAFALTGCSKAKDAADETVPSAVQGTVSDAIADAETVDNDVVEAVEENAAAAVDTASTFYSAYIEDKSAVLNKLLDGLGNNADTAMSALSFLGVSMSDLYLLPALYFGLGETSVSAGLAMMGATDVVYQEQGNNYTITYKNSDGQQTALTGTYDNGKSLIVVGSTNGVENVFAETYRTSFGYVSQFYSIGDDGTTTLYQIAIEGENGVFGIATSDTRPAALTGSEPAEFPKSAKEWYAISGSTITGMTSDGKSVNFEYVPSEDN